MARRPRNDQSDELGDSAMPNYGGMSRALGDSEENSGEEEQPNVTPEEQALYHKFMENYYTIMYVGTQGETGQKEPPLADEVVKNNFSGNVNPIDTLATATVTIVSRLSESAAQAGKPIPPEVLMHVGVEVIEDLSELADSSGFHDYTQQEMTGAVTKAMETYREVNQGSLDTNALKSDYETLMAADKQGNLDEVLPGASKAAESLPAPEEEPAVEEVPPEVRGMSPGMGKV